MKPKLEKILDEVISRGVSYGIHRAYKYSDNPTIEHLEIQLHQALTNEFYEWFNFEESNES